MARPVHILIAPNSFKGSVDAWELADAIAEGVTFFSRISAMRVQTRVRPISDGGTGFSRVIASSHVDSRRMSHRFEDPVGKPGLADYNMVDDRTAVIESAATIGIALVPAGQQNPLHTSTYGLGQAIRHAVVGQGAKRVFLGCGDSATCDCGIGMAAALGARFRADGVEVSRPTGADLARISSVDFTGIPDSIRNVPITVACNLSSIARGANSTARVYAVQKGASPVDAVALDSGINNYAGLVEKQLDLPCLGLLPGSGAAGGVGFGLLAINRRVSLRYSFETVYDAINIDKDLAWADVVITGEGLFDRNSVKGKAPVALALRSKLHRCYCLGIVGGIQQGVMSRLVRSGFDALETLTAENLSLDYFRQNAHGLVMEATTRGLIKSLPVLRGVA